MDSLSQHVGIGAGVLTGISLLPQLVKLIREKKPENVSIGMLVLLLCGLCGWIGYGILKQDYPIIITNCFSLLTNILILILSSLYKLR